MIDLTNEKELANGYGGSEAKKTILYNDKIYMVKFPDPVRGSKIKEISYINNQFSEDIGCKIFKSVGINAQNTFLATYTEKSGKQKIVVACEDFCIPNNAALKEFRNLALAITDSSSNVSTSLEFIHEVLQNSAIIENKEEFENQFWDMFVVDALIGNRDRHLGNFGLLVGNEKSSFSPIYDCGSALSPLLSDEDMKNISNKTGEFIAKEYNISSVFKYQGKRVFYHEIFNHPPKELINAIYRIVPWIDLNNINKIIYDTECMSHIRKEYIFQSVNMRYNKIIKPAYKKLIQTQQSEEIQNIKQNKFLDAYNIAQKIYNFDSSLQFMKDIIKYRGTNTQALHDAVYAVTEAESESMEFAAKLLNDTLKTKEYRKAFEAQQENAEANAKNIG